MYARPKSLKKLKKLNIRPKISDFYRNLKMSEIHKQDFFYNYGKLIFLT